MNNEILKERENFKLSLRKKKQKIFKRDDINCSKQINSLVFLDSFNRFLNYFNEKDISYYDQFSKYLQEINFLFENNDNFQNESGRLISKIIISLTNILIVYVEYLNPLIFDINIQNYISQILTFFSKITYFNNDINFCGIFIENQLILKLISIFKIYIEYVINTDNCFYLDQLEILTFIIGNIVSESDDFKREIFNIISLKNIFHIFQNLFNHLKYEDLLKYFFNFVSFLTILLNDSNYSLDITYEEYLSSILSSVNLIIKFHSEILIRKYIDFERSYNDSLIILRFLNKIFGKSSLFSSFFFDIKIIMNYFQTIVNYYINETRINNKNLLFFVIDIFYHLFNNIKNKNLKYDLDENYIFSIKNSYITKFYNSPFLPVEILNEFLKYSIFNKINQGINKLIKQKNSNSLIKIYKSYLLLLFKIFKFSNSNIISQFLTKENLTIDLLINIYNIKDNSQLSSKVLDCFYILFLNSTDFRNRIVSLTENFKFVFCNEYFKNYLNYDSNLFNQYFCYSWLNLVLLLLDYESSAKKNYCNFKIMIIENLYICYIKNIIDIENKTISKIAKNIFNLYLEDYLDISYI